MKHALVLDTSPLSETVRRPGQSAEADACRLWLRRMIANGCEVYVPEIADYEVRRELARSGKRDSLSRLNAFLTTVNYLPVTTEVMHLAAELWAKARNGGWATADKALDGDVILAAQALMLRPASANLTIVTPNFAHLSRYASAQEWKDIVL